MLLLFQYVILFSSFITFINGENLRTDNEYKLEVAKELSEEYSRNLLPSPEQLALFQKILTIAATRSKSVEERLAEIRPYAIELGTGQSLENSNDQRNVEEFWNSQKQIYKSFIKVNDQFYELVENYSKDDADKISKLESEIQLILFNTTLKDKSPDEIKSIFIEKLNNFEIETIREWHKLKKGDLSDSVCTPNECCDRLNNCSDIALNNQCKQHDYDCQLSCGICNATERGWDAYYTMGDANKPDCSSGYIGESWDDFERATSSEIWTPNNVPYFPGYCLYNMEFDWEVPENCSQLEYWNKYFKGKLKFLHLSTHMHINMSCDTIPEFFKSVEIIMGQGDTIFRDRTKCIVQINDMLGNRTIFDFFPNLKFVGLEYPKQLFGPLICGNTVDEARLSEEQKSRVNRIDQGRLWDFWQFRVDVVPPTGNSSYSLCLPYSCCDRLSNCSDIALSKQCKLHDYDCQLSCGTCNATERGSFAYNGMLLDDKPDCSWIRNIGESWDDFEKATSSKIWTPNNAPYFPGYCLYGMKVDWEMPKNCSQLDHWNKYFNRKLKFLHLSTHMHINMSCDTIPEFFKSVEIIMGEGKTKIWNEMRYNRRCIVQINDMTGNRTIFDFFPNLKFVGLEKPEQLAGPLICGNTIDEARLSEEQKDRINRIDQGRLWDFWQFRVDVVPPTGNSSSYSLCLPYGCCDRLSNCSDIALSKQCKQHDYDCQLSCGICNATEQGWNAYEIMRIDSEIDCSSAEPIGKSWNDFESANSTKISTPNNAPYFPGYCLYGMKVDWEVPENCSQLEYWNKYFNRKLKFLHLRYHMHINTSCGTTPEFFKSVEIMMGDADAIFRDNTKCIVQINDMLGNRTIFDFFPNLKFVGLEKPEQLAGPLICGNTIDEARLSEEQKDRINRIDQGRLWDFWQFRVDAVPPTGNSSSYSLCLPYGCCDRLSNCSDIALSKQCKQDYYDCQLSCGTCNATERGNIAYYRMRYNKKPDCSDGLYVSSLWNDFEIATSSKIWTPNNVPYFPGYCLYFMDFDWKVPKNCSQLEYWNKYFNGKLTFLHLWTHMHINTSCGTTPEFFKSVEIITGQGETEFRDEIRYNTKCIVQINDMTGNRTIFDFFPNLKFVGLEKPEQLAGPLICGNTIDEARLTEEQKNRVNRIDQGHLLGFGKLLGIA